MKKNHCFTWHQHRRHYGQNSYGRDACTRRKTLALMTSTQKTPRAEFLWAKRLHQENPRLHWHQHRRHYGQNSYGHQMFTWRKSLALMTSAHKTPKGRIPKVERSHEEKPLLYLTSTQKTLWAEFLWARRLHKKKNPGSHDINTEDSAGRIPMGKRSQEEKPWLSWHQHRRLRGQNSYGQTLAQEEKPWLSWR